MSNATDSTTDSPETQDVDAPALKRNPQLRADLFNSGAHLVICRVKNKSPIVDDWQNIPATLQQVQSAQLIGVIPSSLGLLCIDIDTDNAAGVNVIRTEVVESLGEPAFQLTTRSGGLHLYYKCDGVDFTYHHYWRVGEEPPIPHAGEVRYKSAQCIVWDANAFLAGLENLNDYDPVDVTRWPIPKTSGSDAFVLRNYTLEQVHEKLGGERAGGGYKLPCPCPGHTDRSPSFSYRPTPDGKHIQFICFAGCGGRAIRETLAEMGLKNSWGGSREGAGRKTFDDVEAAEQIVIECAERLRQIDDGIAVCGNNGLWTFLTHLGAYKHKHLVTDLAQSVGLGPLAAQNAKTLSQTLSVNFWRDLKTASKNDFHFAAPIMAVDHDTSIDLRTGKTGTWPEAMIFDTGATIPMPGKAHEVSDEEAAMYKVWVDQYGYELLHRLCEHLLRQSKSADSIVSPLADAGKGTMISMLSKAMPGAIQHGFASSLVGRKDKFTPTAALLAKAKIVFIDEVDKIDSLPTSALHELCDDTVTVETKGVDPITMPRSGQLVFVGADWPPVDASDQGVMARMRYFHRMNAEHPMTREERVSLLSPNAINALRAMILESCADLHSGKVKYPQVDAEQERDFIAARTPEDKAILKQGYEVGRGFVARAEIGDYMSERVASPKGEDTWKPAEINALVNETFPTARRYQETTGARERGFTGIQKKRNSDY